MCEGLVVAGGGATVPLPPVGLNPPPVGLNPPPVAVTRTSRHVELSTLVAEEEEEGRVDLPLPLLAPLPLPPPLLLPLLPLLLLV